MTAFKYGNAYKHISGDSFVANDLRCMLLTAAYTPDQDAHEFLAAVVANEVVGAGYAAGGQVLAGKAVTYTGATNVLKFTCSSPAWANATITARFAVFYDRTPAADATRPLFVCVRFAADVISTNGAFTVTIDPAGLATITMGVEA